VGEAVLTGEHMTRSSPIRAVDAAARARRVGLTALLIAATLPGVTRAQLVSADAIELLRFEDLDGEVWDAERLRDRVTLIDFWATWCAPCLAELPHLKRARAQYSREDFEILGVSFDVSDRRSFVSWLNRHAVRWPQVFDGRGRMSPAARHFRVDAVPASWLVGPDGRIVARNLRGERLLAAIDDEVARLHMRRNNPRRPTP
jgi:thiol-disulfide isomerase/thioredoxin